MDIIILRLYNCTICAHIIIIQKGIKTGTQTRTYRQAIGQAHCRQSHTDRHLPWAIHCTDWLYATCVDYSISRINDIYTEVISFFSVVIDTYQSQFMVNVDSSPLIFDLFVSILYLIVSCWRKQERVAEHFVFVFVYIVLAWRITQSQDCVSSMYVLFRKRQSFQ